MDWLYYYRNKIVATNQTHPFIRLYLRPYIYNENNDILVGEKVVAIDIMALQRLLEIKPDDKEAIKLYFEKLNDLDHKIEYRELSENEKELYEAKITLYINNSGITIDEMCEWIKKIFILNDYPFTSFKEGVYDHFADTNELMQLFSLKNVQKFEDRLGKDWWKNNNDKQ